MHKVSEIVKVEDFKVVKESPIDYSGLDLSLMRKINALLGISMPPASVAESKVKKESEESTTEEFQDYENIELKSVDYSTISRPALTKVDEDKFKLEEQNSEVSKNVQSLPKRPYNCRKRRCYKVTNTGLFQCTDCEKTFSKSSGASRHFYTIHKNRRFSCDHCDNEFTEKRTLREHRRSQHLGLMYQCDYCDRKFAYKFEISAHLKQVHSNPNQTISKHLKVEQQTAFNSELSDKALKKRVMRVTKADKTKEKTRTKPLRNKRPMKRYKELTSGLFKCIGCEKKFPIKSSVRRHFLTVHENKRYECDQCDSNFIDSRALRDHKRSQHLGVMYQCDYCDREFEVEFSLYSHMKQVHNLNYYKVNQTSKDSANVDRYTKSEDVSKTSELPDTGESPKASELIKTKDFHKTEDLSKSDGLPKTEAVRSVTRFRTKNSIKRQRKGLKIQRKVLQSENKSNQSQDQTNNSLDCDQCTSRFTDQNTLRDHKRSKHLGIMYKCDYCNRQYAFENLFVNHVQKVHGLNDSQNAKQASLEMNHHQIQMDKPNVNNEIPKVETNATNIEAKEQKVETYEINTNDNDQNVKIKEPKNERKLKKLLKKRKRGRKPTNKSNDSRLFQCEDCDKEFKENRSFQDHKRSTHLGILYNCDQCDKGFNHKKSLTRHIAVAHEGIRYTCKECKREFTEKRDLRDHIRYLHMGIKYECDHCDKKFINKQYVASHLRTAHGIINQGWKNSKQEKEINSEILKGY